MSSGRHLILIVEDDALVSIAVEDLVSDGGFDFVSSRTGDEAITELETDAARFCAVLTDIRMPGSSTGWDVARRARELAPAMPVIYMTGDSASQWSANGVPNSILLQKPFVDAQLMTALANLLIAAASVPQP
ncbi:response regulator [Neorhizobium sp. NPDC001467]|uniref:response regulator n=1 Tax=Neorhizobium sp. NPDC001467 TaxID=3390595 RepID=UPI003D0656FC